MAQSVGAATEFPRPESSWYVLHVKPHNERRVCHQLSSKSIPTFLPLIETINRRRVRHHAVLRPLFPCYAFVYLDDLKRDPRAWDAVRWTPGVRTVLGTDDTPVPVPREAVAAIQERVKDFGFACPGIPFPPGSRVRIRNGPCEGLEAVFERPMSGPMRVRVLIDLLGRQTGLEIDVRDLEDA